jgi:hypothetical protein
LQVRLADGDTVNVAVLVLLSPSSSVTVRRAWNWVRVLTA